MRFRRAFSHGYVGIRYVLQTPNDDVKKVQRALNCIFFEMKDDAIEIRRFFNGSIAIYPHPAFFGIPKDEYP